MSEVNGSIGSALASCAARLKRADCADATFEARRLLSHALGADDAALILRAREAMPAGAADRLEGLILRRESGEPLQYILGEWGFMGLDLKVDGRALIPRQDTETLCAAAEELIARRGYSSCLDLCTGSGCIGLALAARTGVSVTLADVSAAALSLAGENAQRLRVPALLVQSDLFADIPGKYDLIVSNPPYLSARDMASLQRELAFEPAGALFGGEDGLDLYRRIALECRAHLNPGGALLLETGAGQSAAVAGLLAGGETRIYKDLCGIERVVESIW